MKTHGCTSFFRQGFCLFLICLTTWPLLRAQDPEPNVHWISSYGEQWGASNDGVEWSWSIVQTSDGGYISAGFTTLVPGPNTDPSVATVVPALTKMGPHGERQWTRSFPDGHIDKYGFFFQVIEVDDGYVAVGRKEYPVAPIANCGTLDRVNRIFLVKIGFDGNNEIIVKHELGCDSFGTGIQELPGGGFAVSAYSSTYLGPNATPAYRQDIHLVRLNPDLTLAGPNAIDTYNSGEHDRAHSIALTYNASGTHDGYVIAGYQVNAQNPASVNVPTANLPNPGSSLRYQDRDAWVIRADLTGNMLWDYTMNSTNFPLSWYTYQEPGTCSPTPADTSYYHNSQDEARSIIQLSDGSFALTVANNTTVIKTNLDVTPIAWSCTTPSGLNHGEYLSADIGLIRLDANGNEIYNKNIAHFSGDDWIPQVEETLDGELVIVGTTAYPPNLKGPMQDPILINMKDVFTTSPQTSWRKITKWDGSMGMCGFSVDVCNDGGFVMSGNNTVNNEDWQFVKLYSDCQPGLDLAPVDIDAAYDVTGTQTWSSPRKVMAEVVVKSGATLNISNTTIQFGDVRQLNDYTALASNLSTTTKPRIKVEAGGTLVINNSTLKGLNGCGASNMWEGLTVLGNPNAGPALQGKIVLNNSTIQDAIKGIRAGGVFYNGHGHPHTNASHGGGIIEADHTTFRNCRRSVHFTTYPYSVSAPNQTQSFFTSCTFETTTPLVDPDYISQVDTDLLSELHGQPLGVNAHLTFWNTHGVKIKGNAFQNFLNLPPKLRGTGVGGIDASYTLERDCINQGTCTGPKNTFENLYYGINALNGGGTNVLNITRSEFSNCTKGIRLTGLQFPRVTRNTFSIPTQSSGDGTYGLYLLDCDGYQVEGNSFQGSSASETTFGVWVENEDPNNNYSANRIYRNSFANLTQSSTGSKENRGTSASNGLEFKCNEYNTVGSDIVAANMPGISEYQGYVIPGDPTSPAGNRFSGCLGAGAEILNNGGQLVYVHHNSPNTTPGCLIGPVSLGNSMITFDSETACPSSFPNDNDDEGPEGLIDDDIDDIEQILADLEEAYGNEPTQELEEELAYYTRKRSLLVSRLVRAYLNNSNEDIDTWEPISQLLQEEGSPEAYSHLPGIYMQAGELEMAESAISDLKEAEGYADYADLQDLRLQWLQGDGNMYSLLTEQELNAQLSSWADNPASSAHIYALAIREWVLGERIEENLASSEGVLRRAREEAVSEKPASLLAITPNPAQHTVRLISRLDQVGTFEIINLQGQLVMQGTLERGEAEEKVDISQLAAGIYLVRVRSGNSLLDIQKLVVR